MRCFLNVPALSAIPGERLRRRCAVPAENAEKMQKRIPEIVEPEEAFLQARVLREGSDVTIISAGEMTRECAESCRILESRGIRAELIDARVLKPLDAGLLRRRRRRRVSYLSQKIMWPPADSAAAWRSLCRSPQIEVYKIAWPDEFISHGTQAELKKKYGMNAEAIAERVREGVEGKA